VVAVAAGAADTAEAEAVIAVGAVAVAEEIATGVHANRVTKIPFQPIFHEAEPLRSASFYLGRW
jgi:hypothetical protein